MSARLVPLSAGAAPVVWLQRPVLLIGRHPECDVRLDLPQVSRRHCCLAQAYDRVFIRDLGSRNGVRVNGRLIDEATLVPGDELAIAQVIYRLEDVPERPVVEPAHAQPTTISNTPASLPELPLDTDDSDQDLLPLDDLLA